MKQTPVEWLMDQINKKWTYIPPDWWKEIEDIVVKAKKMEKQDEEKYIRQIADLNKKLDKFTYKDD